MGNQKTTRLTDEQIEVLILMAQGNSIVQVAEIIGSTEAAVSNALTRTRRKLEARNTLHAVVIAIRQGLI